MHLDANRMLQADFKRNQYRVTLADYTNMDSVLEPGFWSQVAMQLQQGDRIEVYKEDGTEWAELIVQYSDRVSAKVAFLSRVDLKPQSADEVDPDYKVEWAGPHDKWRVVRLSDKEKVRIGEPSRERANAWLSNYVKGLAA